MSAGIELLGVLWRALDLHLPLGRVSDGRRFLDGRPLARSTRSDVLRAFARTFIEARYLPIRKDAHRDPVELIAAALDVAIGQWSLEFRSGEELGLARACEALAVRVAAFEMLFGLPPPNGGPWSGVLDALASHDEPASSRDRQRFRDACRHARRVLATVPAAHRDALLAEVVVLGSASSALQPVRAIPGIAIEAIDVTTIVIAYAKGVLLLAQGKVEVALEVFASMLARAPGSVLALEQAARCCATVSDRARITAPSRKAPFDGESLASANRRYISGDD